MAYANDVIFDDRPMDEDFVEGIIDTKNAYMISIYAQWVGHLAEMPTGNLIMQLSNDGVNWHDHTTQAAGGAAGNKWFEEKTLTSMYVRLLWDLTSGNGKLTAWFCTKGV